METKALDNEPIELTDEEMEEFVGGRDWEKFGNYVLANGGSNYPELAELIMHIIAKDWHMVKIESCKYPVCDNPIVINGLAES